jgi:hypothetical protein
LYEERRKKKEEKRNKFKKKNGSINDAAEEFSFLCRGPEISEFPPNL